MADRPSSVRHAATYTAQIAEYVVAAFADGKGSLRSGFSAGLFRFNGPSFVQIEQAEPQTNP